MVKILPMGRIRTENFTCTFMPDQIDNFDKSYCESVEKITEETKIRYKKIYSSEAYNNAFIAFYFNKDIAKYQRNQRKSLKVKELSKKEENNDKTENINEVINENNCEEKLLSVGTNEIKDKNDNNIFEK